MTSKQLLREHNIQTVIAAALELFLKNGIETTTIDNIALHANVSKMSIFRYFESKTDIVKATTKELFQNADYQIKKYNFSNDSDLLNGMQFAKKLLQLFPLTIHHHPQFLNYLCELVLFFSRHELELDFPQTKQLESLWVTALEKGMADQSIGFIENHETFYPTLHNVFSGVILRLYLDKRNLSSSESVVKLQEITNRMVDMTIKYLMP